MTYQDTMAPAEVLSKEITATRNFFAGVGRFFANLGESMTLASTGRQRMAIVERLQAKSDAELADMGIKRDEIVHVVFKDLYYI